MDVALPPGADLSKIPLMPNPNGDPPNFVNPPSRYPLAIGVGLPLAIISFLCLVLRILSSLKTMRKLVIDDYLCIVGYVGMVTYLGLGLSLGTVLRHSWDVPLSAFDKSTIKRTFAYNVLAAWAIPLPKIAIIALYLRLFKPERWSRIICYLCLFLIVAFIIAATTVSAVACAPVRGQWVLREICGEWPTHVSVAGGSLYVLVDIAIFYLPFPIIYHLNLPKRKKLGLMVVFTIGILGIICSIISLRYRIQISTATDKLWNGGIVDACVYAEGFITIMVSCAPAIYTIWSKHFINSALYSRIRSSLTRSAHSQSKTSDPPNSWSFGGSNKSSGPQRFRSLDDYQVELLPPGLSTNQKHASTSPPSQGIMKATTIDQWSLEKK